MVQFDICLQQNMICKMTCLGVLFIRIGQGLIFIAKNQDRPYSFTIEEEKKNEILVKPQFYLFCNTPMIFVNSTQCLFCIYVHRSHGGIPIMTLRSN